MEIAEVIIFILVFGFIILRVLVNIRQQSVREQQRDEERRQQTAQRNMTPYNGGSLQPSTTRGSYTAPAAGTRAHPPKNNPRQQPPRGVPARKPQTGPNQILERAKANTSDVHRSHSIREAEAEARRAATKVQQPQTEFGSASFGSAVSGLDSIQTPQQRKARLEEQMRAEKTDSNSQSGRNRIMESAKENAIQTQLDNITDGERNLMKEVRDLMVTGPHYELPFSRDFVAEGMELLNSYYQVKGF